MALGFFTLIIQGRRFGVQEEDATMLANSYGEVCRRIAGRGRHTAPFGGTGNPYEIASSVVGVVYDEPPEMEGPLRKGYDELTDLVYKNRLVWAPDGDEAFDDGSHVLQLDVGDEVRLIAFKRFDDRPFDPVSLVDQRLSIDEFYSILEDWRDGFVSEWEQHPKESRV